MASLHHPHWSQTTKIDEYARLQLENKEEAARLEREQAMQSQRARAASVRAELDAQSSHFQKNFHTLTASRVVASKPRVKRDDSWAQRNADYYGFYYGQL